MKSTPRGHTPSFIGAIQRRAVPLTAVLLCATARAQEPAPEPAPAAPPANAPEPAPAVAAPAAPESPPPTDSKPAFTKTVGGHIGIATPLVTVASETKTIGDQFTILNPIGIGFHVSENWIVDFETVVANPINPSGTTGLVVDPGIIYGMGRVAVGLRLAFQINHDTNVGGIPLVNVGLVDLGGATWFAEAAFPTFYSDKKGELNVVLHTGIGF